MGKVCFGKSDKILWDQTVVLIKVASVFILESSVQTPVTITAPGSPEQYSSQMRSSHHIMLGWRGGRRGDKQRLTKYGGANPNRMEAAATKAALFRIHKMFCVAMLLTSSQQQ